MFVAGPLTAAVVLYCAANLGVFVIYGVDKHRARTGGWRIPERVLLLAALAGPFGAWAGMHLFRHKTRKILFYLVPAFVVLHLVVIGYIAALLAGIIP